eukprot:TRINITY_DN4569_c0_g1_i2.p1 TRINITY_DN4569_c0_g1~~TRINITY_DN4569_c0_g1_i2.p1  ORF type:complete len:303 (-),score=81.79 TRINITY_DN4569_c0_g1_i2:145-1053(-)
MQRQAASDLIDSMDLTQVQDPLAGEKQEMVQCNQMFNPILQYFYQCAIDKAVDQEEEKNELKPLDPIINDAVHPENIMQTNCKEEIKNFGKQFKLKVNEIKKEVPKIFWKQLLEQKKKEGILATGETGDDEMQSGIQEEQIANKKFNFDQEDQVKDISEMNPIEDFQTMISNKKEDLVETAVEQMSNLIRKLIINSLNGNFYPKAFSCLQALRKGCITEDEAVSFNDFLFDIRQDFAVGKHEQFWKIIVENNVTLITNSESIESGITTEEAKEFLSTEKVPESQSVVLGSIKEQENLMDEIE